jgi:hypothetical protein
MYPKVLVHFFSILFLTASFSCTQKKAIQYNLTAIKTYFETDDIQVDNSNDVTQLIINNSSLVAKKQKNMGQNWVNAEALASVGAVNFISLNEDKIDSNSSTIYKIRVNDTYEKYEYANKDILLVQEQVRTSNAFIKAIFTRDYSSIKPFLGDKILESEEIVQRELPKIFPGNGFERTELGGFKIENARISIYLHIYYTSTSAQTYVFTYFQERGSKVEGLSMP